MSVLCRLDAVSKRYGAREVLRVPALEIRRGETLALVGPSGSGKSTLLRLLCLLEAPDAGALVFAGVPAGFPAPLALRRRVTLCFQRPLLLDRSVRDNVRLALQLRSRSDDTVVDALLDKLGLMPLARANARTLSGGEAQRVALARALVIAPDLLLLDEPTANLDPVNVALIERVAAEACAAHGATVVWVTHNLGQARRVADRVAFLLEGDLIEVTAAASFFDAPVDARAAAFVRGDMVW
jgi:tungstate transport system ATP-binding protein